MHPSVKVLYFLYSLISKGHWANDDHVTTGLKKQINAVHEDMHCQTLSAEKIQFHF